MKKRKGINLLGHYCSYIIITIAKMDQFMASEITKIVNKYVMNVDHRDQYELKALKSKIEFKQVLQTDLISNLIVQTLKCM